MPNVAGRPLKAGPASPACKRKASAKVTAFMVEQKIFLDVLFQRAIIDLFFDTLHYIG